MIYEDLPDWPDSSPEVQSELERLTAEFNEGLPYFDESTGRMIEPDVDPDEEPFSRINIDEIE